MRGVEQIPWFYDAFCWLMERRGLIKWRRKLVGGATGRILEVGVGTGRNLPLYPDSAKLIGLEPDVVVLKAARRKAPGIPVVVGSAEALPFRDAAFDTVVSGLVFCSVPDPLRGLAEARRVLVSGGQIRMLEHVRATRPFFAKLQDLLQPAWTALAGGCHPNRDTEANVEHSGFTIDEADRRARGNMRLFRAYKGKAGPRARDQGPGVLGPRS